MGAEGSVNPEGSWAMPKEARGGSFTRGEAASPARGPNRPRFLQMKPHPPVPPGRRGV